MTLPNGRRKRLSNATLRRKVRRFHQQKIAGLRRRRRRNDRGQARKQRQQMVARAVELYGSFLGVVRRYDREQGVHPELPPANAEVLRVAFLLVAQRIRGRIRGRLRAPRRLRG
ncbi:MAG: hypothetical protein ACYC0X_04880 [Pirellulaceae bacterium]